METLFASDFHFGHKNIIRYCQRPFVDADEMNAQLIQNWNSVVNRSDEVWFLGDFSFMKMKDTQSVFDALNGKKHLVRGNHDSDAVCKELAWKSVQDYKELRINSKMYVLCHYPLEVWNRAHHGAFHLHGHSHGSLQRILPNRIDVGVDLHPEYRPFTLDEVHAALASTGPYERLDHHGDGRESGSNEG